MTTNENEQTGTRRDFLKVGGAAITASAMLHYGASLTTATQTVHELVINAPPRGDGAHPYMFSAGGTVRKLENATMAPVNNDHVTVDAEDIVEDCGVHGWTAGGYDAYEFTGDLVIFSVPEQWEDRYTVYLDGQKIPARDLQTDDPDVIECGTGGSPANSGGGSDGGDSGGSGGDSQSEYPSAIHIVVPKGSGAVFSLGTTGKMKLPDGTVTSQVTANMGGIGATGDAVRIPYSGTFAHMDLSDNDITVRVVQDGAYD